MDTVNGLMLLDVLLAPLVAVQVTKWLEHRRNAGLRRLSIFQTLMRTRMQRLSAEHVNALNMIDVEFYGKKRAYTAVIRAWHDYLDSLNTPNSDAVYVERQRLFIELLYVMAQALGYDLDRTAIKQLIYVPTAHADLELDQAAIRAGVVALLTGKLAIPVQVVDSPPAGQAEAIAAMESAGSQSLGPQTGPPSAPSSTP